MRIPIFDGLFGRGDKGRGADGRLAEHLACLESMREPAVWLKKGNSCGFSKIGGMPEVPSGFEWPRWEGEPLSFLCQVDLAEIPAGSAGSGIPRSGCLYFFSDQEQRTWGFSPSDRGSWFVHYETVRAPSPAEVTPPDGLRHECIYPENRVQMCPVRTWPDCQSERVKALGLTAEQEQALCKLWLSTFGGRPAHQLFGSPCSIQPGPMDLECQLVSNGINCGSSADYDEAMAAELEPGRKDWMLLLQLDTDEDIEMMWGDRGRLYFWIRKTDLAAGHLGECWMVLQCF